MPAQALPVGERGAFLLSGQGRLPSRAVRLQCPVQLAAPLRQRELLVLLRQRGPTLGTRGGQGGVGIGRTEVQGSRHGGRERLPEKPH